jgi:hypothetical protein
MAAFVKRSSKRTEKIASNNVKKGKPAGYGTQADSGISFRSSTTDAGITDKHPLS